MPSMTTESQYHNFQDLINGEARGYHIEWVSRISNVLVMAPHGGGIEPGTTEIVKAMAEDGFSWYCFNGTNLIGNDHLHITSTRFDEPIAIGMLGFARIVLAVHGCRSRRKIIFVGGLHTVWVQRFIEAFKQAGFNAERGEYNISGVSPRNICNRGVGRQGVQIELTEGLRKDLFLSLDSSADRKQTTPLFDLLTETGRKMLLQLNCEI